MNDSRQTAARADSGGGSVSRLLRGCFLGAAAALLISVFVVVALFGLLIATAVVQSQTPRVAEPVRIREVHISGPLQAPKIAVINIEGLLYGSSQPSGTLTPVALICAKLEKAFSDPEVRGVLLLVDSGGGGVTGADILHQRIQTLRDADDARPIVASILDIGASGAYYSICGVDKIIAHPTSLTGSIGVLMPLFDATELLKKIGISDESILSGDYKDLGSPFSERPQDVKERQREMLSDIVQSMHDRFVDVVAQSRGLEPESVGAVADGRILTAGDALEARLIDSIGYENDAIAALSEMAGVANPKVVQYRREFSFGMFMTSLVRARAIELGFLSLPDELLRLRSRPMYLWVGD